MWKEEKDIDRFVAELVILMDLPSRPFVVFSPYMYYFIRPFFSYF